MAIKTQMISATRSAMKLPMSLAMKSVMRLPISLAMKSAIMLTWENVMAANKGTPVIMAVEVAENKLAVREEMPAKSFLPMAIAAEVVEMGEVGMAVGVVVINVVGWVILSPTWPRLS